MVDYLRSLNNYMKNIGFVLLLVFISLSAIGGCNNNGSEGQPIPDDILAIMNHPRFANTIWGLKVVDLDTGELIYNLTPDFKFELASVRKLFSVGVGLEEFGADFKYETPVYKLGQVDESGHLNGDLILVAIGDLTMGGRRLPDGTVAFTNLPHTDANALGAGILTKTNPLAGLDELAQQIVDSGITKITGDVIIDDRLFIPFFFGGDTPVTPIVINDNLIDVTITPTEPGEPALVTMRPQTEAFTIESSVITVAQGMKTDVELSQDVPGVGVLAGQIAVGFEPFPGVTNLVQTFQALDPPSFARTLFIEALERAGVEVMASSLGPNPDQKLPPENSYTEDELVAELISLPYSEYAKLILKISHNLGANLNLMLIGVANGTKVFEEAIEIERQKLINVFGLNGNDFVFTDGGGAPGSISNTCTTIDLLKYFSGQPDEFTAFFESLPILGVDGSLAFVGRDSPAKGNVRAKTGTLVSVDQQTGTITYKAQNLGGYIDSKSGRNLVYTLFANDIAFNDISDIFEVGENLGEISTLIYEHN